MRNRLTAITPAVMLHSNDRQFFLPRNREAVQRRAFAAVADADSTSGLSLNDMKTSKLAPIHPGEILREEFMKPRGLSQNALARALNVPPRRINEIVLEKRAITADTALRLSRYFGTSAEMWLGLQADYDLRRVRFEKARIIEREVEPLAA